MRHRREVIVLLVLTQLCADCQRRPGKYSGGQEWRYKTRAGEELSRLIVEDVLIDASGTEVVIVSISNVHISRNRYSGDEIRTISSAPFTVEALEKSAAELVLGQSGRARLTDADLLVGPSVEELRKGLGQPIRVTVADFLDVLENAKWPPLYYDTPPQVEAEFRSRVVE